jgi:hypothetical protein
VSSVKNLHIELTTAGWSYRTNDRGWVIYRHPLTGLWHTRPEAAAIAEAEAFSVLTSNNSIALAPAARGLPV